MRVSASIRSAGRSGARWRWRYLARPPRPRPRCRHCSPGARGGCSQRDRAPPREFRSRFRRLRWRSHNRQEASRRQELSWWLWARSQRRWGQPQRFDQLAAAATDISALTACATELHTRFAAATAAKATADQAIIDKNASRARAEVVARAAIRRQKASTALQRGARRPVPRAGRRRLDRHDGRQARAHARRYGAVQEVAFLRGRLGLAAGARGAVSSRLLLSSQHVLLDRWRSV